MTSTTVNAPFAAADRGFIKNLFANWAEARAKRAVYKSTVRELSVLSDRELSDLGLSRYTIQSVAMEAAYAK